MDFATNKYSDKERNERHAGVLTPPPYTKSAPPISRGRTFRGSDATRAPIMPPEPVGFQAPPPPPKAPQELANVTIPTFKTAVVLDSAPTTGPDRVNPGAVDSLRGDLGDLNGAHEATGDQIETDRENAGKPEGAPENGIPEDENADPAT